MRHVFRIGDKVIINPDALPVKRVGYPLIWTDVTIDQIKADQQLSPILETMDRFISSSKSYEQLWKGVCMAYVEKHKFGGDRRYVIRYESWDEWVSESATSHGFEKPDLSNIAVVMSKKVHQTGRRVPPSITYYGERDPGYLDEMKTVIVLELAAGEGIVTDTVLMLSTDVAVFGVKK